MVVEREGFAFLCNLSFFELSCWLINLAGKGKLYHGGAIDLSLHVFINLVQIRHFLWSIWVTDSRLGLREESAIIYFCLSKSWYIFLWGAAHIFLQWFDVIRNGRECFWT